MRKGAGGPGTSCLWRSGTEKRGLGDEDLGEGTSCSLMLSGDTDEFLLQQKLLAGQELGFQHPLAPFFSPFS